MAAPFVAGPWESASVSRSLDAQRFLNSLDSGTVGPFLDPFDMSTLFQDAAGTTPVTASGQPVHLMLDKSGLGLHFSGVDGVFHEVGDLRFVRFNGSSAYLRCLFTAAQPIDRISAIRQISWTGNDQIFGAGAGGDRCILYQHSATPRVSIYAGTVLAGPTTVAIDETAIITERYDGNSSRVCKNSDAYITGAAGATVPGGMTIGASWNGAQFGNFDFFGCVVKHSSTVMTDTQIEEYKAYLAGLTGVTL